MLIVPEMDIEYIDCNIPELDYDEWSISKAYLTGDKVSVAGDNKNYFATKDIEAGVKPLANDPKGVKTGWFSETSNRYKMLEKNIYNQTKNDNLIAFSFRAINIDTIGFFNVEAKEIYIKFSDFSTGSILYEKMFDMASNEISLFHYFFSQTWLKDRLFFRPPLFMSVKIDVEIRRPGAVAKCGKVFVGQAVDLGISLVDGSSIKTKRFGLVKQDEYFGNYEIEKGNIVNQTTVPVFIKTEKLDYTLAMLKKYAYDFCLFIGDEKQSISNFTVYGVAEDTSFTPKPYGSTYTLKIGGTI